MDLQKELTAILQAEVDSGRETGAQIAVMRNGEVLASVCAGVMGPGKMDRKVAERTLFPVFSTGKAFISTAALRMVDRGELKLDMPVRELWPEFACNGKENVTVRHIFMHRSGICVRPYYKTFAEINDWPLMRSRVEQHRAAFTPGTQSRYQTVNYGWLLGELMMRTDPKHRSLKAIIQEEAIEPYSTGEIYFGVDDEASARTVTLLPAKMELTPPDPEPPWDYCLTAIMNTEAIRRDCLPGFNGIASALGMAKHMDALLRGKFLSAGLLAEAHRDISTPGDIASHGLGYGIMPGGDQFGHGGYGGSYTGGNVKTGMSYGYTCLQMGDGRVRNFMDRIISPDAGADCQWDPLTGQLVQETK